MIVELKGIKLPQDICEPLKINLKEMQIERTQEGRYITVITEEGKILVLYLPKGKPYQEIVWSEDKRKGGS